MQKEEEYQKELAEAGVDLTELNSTDETEKTETSKTEEDTENSDEKDQEETQTLQEPKEPRKRSIYDEYKDTKRDLKSEKEIREQVEQERDELAQKLLAITEAGTKQERTEAQDDIQAFLSKHEQLDADAIRDLVALAQRGVKPEIPEDIRQELDEFKAWKSQNQQAIEKNLFEEDYKESLPELKEIFPTAEAEDLDAIKAELDKLSHTKEFHDKELPYVAFKNKAALSALITPRKKGMEQKGRRDTNETAFEFNPNADYGSMTPKEREQWEAEYAKASKTEGLATDGQGRKILI